jgi:ERCC4-related helicase
MDVIIGDILKDNIEDNARLSIVAPFFSIFAYDALKKELRNINELRFLFSSFNPNNFFLLGEEGEKIFRNQLNQSYIARECASWLAKKVSIKQINPKHSVANHFIHIKNNEKETVIQGISSFSGSGLGYAPSSSLDIPNTLTEPQYTKKYLEWFNNIWENNSQVSNIKEKILSELKRIYKNNPPEFIYFITLYNIFKDFLEDLDEDRVIKVQTGFKNTLIWNKLYSFQKDAVLGAIDKIEKYNGCIIADSVGLGKTFEALAIIKYYELRNDRVLVLCPKRLRENWSIYTVNDKRNFLASDRFNYDILNFTDLTREKGFSGEINLETLNWGNYDLVVIDESHNFRNNNPRKEGKTRYQKLMDEIIRSGVKTKVLMLSATPVNNRLADLKNQIAFITEGIDSAFANSGIKSIEVVLRKAQIKFNKWQALSNSERTLENLLNMLNFDYFKLLDMLTIARSRKHIQKYYNIAEIGDFPERLKPINIKSDIDIANEFPPLLQINRQIQRLNLAAYSPLKYVRFDKLESYNKKYDTVVKRGQKILKQRDREESLINLMRVNLLKRMESSINSFAITIKNLLSNIEELLNKLRSNENEIENLEIFDIDVESDEFAPLLIGGKTKVLIQDIDKIKWEQELEYDKNMLSNILHEALKIDANRDAKLSFLKKEIIKKINNPINNNNKKILIFTAFADTANYLYENIANWLYQNFHIHTALITGTGSNKTTLNIQNKDMNTLLINFSPISKERNKIMPEITEEIDVLIATDCISEGQNLQDCDYLINYDIHWNPVRIIQRFGRIDRLGSKNKKIQLVNFWPNMELDEYINLEARVSGRMVLLDVSATGEENIIEYDDKRKMNDLEYRKRQLEQLQNKIIDLEDIEGTISITDITLNDIKMDLIDYIESNNENLKNIPTGLYSIVPSDDKETFPQGVIFCLKLLNDNIDVSQYGLHPYYLVYVTNNETIFLNFNQAKMILDRFKKLCKGNNSVFPNMLDEFNRETNNGKNMHNYVKLLKKAVYDITKTEEIKEVESLFSRGGTVANKNMFRGIDDFEVISYLIIK